MAVPSNKDPQFKLRIPQDLKNRVELAALKSSRSATAEIIATLEQNYPKPRSDGISLKQLLADLEEAEYDDRLSLMNGFMSYINNAGEVVTALLDRGPHIDIVIYRREDFDKANSEGRFEPPSG